MQPKLYLIPGTMCNQRLWDPIQERLSHKYEFIHLSIPKNKNFSEITTLLSRKLHEPESFVVGFSLGGYIATLLALEYPSIISKLLIISNSATVLSQEELAGRQSALHFISTHGYSGMSRRRAMSMLDSNKSNKAALKTLLLMDSEMGIDELMSQYTYTSERSDLAKRVLESKLQFNLVYGESDPLVNVQWVEQLLAAGFSGNVTKLNTDSHMLPLEHPQQIAELILSC